MKRVHIVGVLLVLLAMSGCGLTKSFTSQQFLNIRQGMTQEEVVSVMGAPAYRRFDREVEEWEYRGYLANTGWTVAVVNFEDGRVVGMDTFEDYTVAPPPVAVVPAPPTTTVVVAPDRNPPYCSDSHDSSPRKVMATADFARFFQSLKSGFSSERMKKIREEMGRVRFTSAQCREMVGIFAFGDEKIEFAKTVYPRVADKENFFTVVDKLSHFDKKTVNEFIEQYNKRR